MPVPSTVEEFLEVGTKSGVLDKRSFDSYVEQLRSTAALPESPSRLAKLMVRDGILTTFQATQFLQGKWRRFVISGKYVLLERLGSGGAFIDAATSGVQHRDVARCAAAGACGDPGRLRR